MQSNIIQHIQTKQRKIIKKWDNVFPLDRSYTYLEVASLPVSLLGLPTQPSSDMTGMPDVPPTAFAGCILQLIYSGTHMFNLYLDRLLDIIKGNQENMGIKEGQHPCTRYDENRKFKLQSAWRVIFRWLMVKNNFWQTGSF